MPEKDSTEVLSHDGWFRVHLSANNMEAALTLEPPVGEGGWPTRADALEALRTHNVNYGILEAEVNRLVEKRLTESVTVARGKPPEPGLDAELKLFFEVGSLWKFDQNDEAERVDYRDVQTLQNVTAGQVIGEKIPATAGVPGCTISGREIPPKNGKDKLVRLGKNVYWSDDGLKIISKIDGEPSCIQNQLNVNPVHEIRGDVNFQSGNIVFVGSLVVYGNVDSGFRVEAEGDITIKGSVEAADLKAGGNITIQGGVSGRDKSNISCEGDLIAKYLEHAKVDCGGNVVAREAIMHCEINADGNIIVEIGKGLIVGGVLRAGEVIAAKTVGSRLGTATELETGVKPKLKIELDQLDVTINSYLESIEKAEKTIVLLERIPHLPPDRQAMYQNLLKTVMTLRERLAQAEARRKELVEESAIALKNLGRIRVKEILYPGVRASIAGAVMITRDEYKYVLLVYNEGEVQIQAYR